MKSDSQSAHCPAHPADPGHHCRSPVRGKGSAVPRGHYARASSCDGIAVTLYDSIHQDYVLDNVCFVQTWLPGPGIHNRIDLIKRTRRARDSDDTFARLRLATLRQRVPAVEWPAYMHTDGQKFMYALIGEILYIYI